MLSGRFSDINSLLMIILAVSTSKDVHAPLLAWYGSRGDLPWRSDLSDDQIAALSKSAKAQRAYQVSEYIDIDVSPPRSMSPFAGLGVGNHAAANTSCYCDPILQAVVRSSHSHYLLHSLTKVN